MAHESFMSLASLTTVDKGGDFIFLRLLFVFSREMSVAPQLWGNCTTVVGQLHHNCGAVAPQLWGNGNDGETNSFLTFGNGETGWKFGIRNWNWSNVKAPRESE